MSHPQTERRALKHEVFLRLNTGGEILNPQEIRNVAYRGPLNELVYELAENHFLRAQFKVVPPGSPAYRQMTDAEYVLRFFMLSETWREFRGELRSELDHFMAQYQFAQPPFLSTIRRRFEGAIGAAAAIWGDHAFKRPGRDQALAGLFDAQMLALAELDDLQHQRLAQRSAQTRKATDRLFSDPDFDENVRRATNTPQRLRDRTTRMLEALRQAAA